MAAETRASQIVAEARIGTFQHWTKVWTWLIWCCIDKMKYMFIRIVYRALHVIVYLHNESML
jgi:hypothetical protein